METVTLPKTELEQLHRELETLRNSSLYKRLLEFEKSISEGKRFTRADLGFWNSFLFQSDYCCFLLLWTCLLFQISMTLCNWDLAALNTFWIMVKNTSNFISFKYYLNIIFSMPITTYLDLIKTQLGVDPANQFFYSQYFDSLAIFALFFILSELVVLISRKIILSLI